MPGFGGELVPHVDIMVRATDAGHRAHFHGALRCASWAVCPMCSSALRMERGAEVTRCAAWWRTQGGALELLTLTFAHYQTDNVHDLNRWRQKAWRKLFAGNPGKRLKWALGIEHYVRGTDDTYGQHGWHPHFHVVAFTLPRTPAERERAVRMLKTRWCEVVRQVMGREHVPTWKNGADLRPCRKDEYLAKLGLELVAAHVKRGKNGGANPWEIARRAAAGDERACELWESYAAAMKGVRQLVWSRELRKAASLGAERTDQEIADAEGQDAPEQHIASIPGRLWDDVAHRPGVLLALKTAAETGGRMAVAVELARYAWGLSPPDPGEHPDQLTLALFDDIAPVVDPDRSARAA